MSCATGWRWPPTTAEQFLLSPARAAPSYRVGMPRRAVPFAVVLLVVACLTACSGGAGSPGDLRTGSAPRAAVDAFVAATGQAEFTELGFLADHATAIAPSKPGASTLELWDYKAGHAIHLAPEASSSDDAAALFDSHRLDFAQVPAAVRKAVKLTGMPVNAETHVVVQRTFAGGDGAGGLGPPTIEVLFDDGHRDAHVSYDFALVMVEKGGSLFAG
jgi:hypothetical protein